jgi:DNA-directed RNA polymerase specialized sigma24 family protein
MSLARTEILESLFKNRQIAETISKMNPDHIREDLKSELFCVLCELKEDRLVDMHERGFLVFYAIRTILTMAKSNRSTFYKKFRKENAELDVNLTDIPDTDYEDFVGDVMNAYDGLHFVEREILKAYSKLKSLEAVSRDTGVPLATVKRIMSNAKRRIHEILKKTAKMEIKLSIPITISTTRLLEPDEITDMIDSYASHIKRRLTDINIEDDISMLTKLEQVYPRISKITNL